MKKQTFKKSLLALGVAGAMLGAVGNAGAQEKIKLDRISLHGDNIEKRLSQEEYVELAELLKGINEYNKTGPGVDPELDMAELFIRSDINRYEGRQRVIELRKAVTKALNKLNREHSSFKQYTVEELDNLNLDLYDVEQVIDQHTIDLDHLGQINGQQFALINDLNTNVDQHRKDLNALKNENAQQSALINTKADKDDLNALDKLTHTKASKTELEEAILAIEHNANNINETQFDLENVKQDVAEQQKTLVSINDEVVKIKDTNTQQDTRLNTVELKTDVLKLALDGKANKNEIDNQLAQKADKKATEAALAKKADTSALAELSKQLDAKASKAVINNLEQRITQVDKTMSRGFATQAALSGLFQPYSLGKANVTAAVGGYKSESALAVGVGYRFDTNVAAKAGVAFNTRGGAATYNAAINYEW